MKVLKYAAMLLICFGLIGATIVMSVPSVRAQVSDIFVEIYERNFGINFKPDENKPTYIEKEMKPTYIPDNWTIECRYSNNMSISYILKGQKGERVYFTQSVHNLEESLENSANMVKENIIINNVDGTLFKYADERIEVLWGDNYAFKIYTTNTNIDIVIKIAESVK